MGKCVDKGFRGVTRRLEDRIFSERNRMCDDRVHHTTYSVLH